MTGYVDELWKALFSIAKLYVEDVEKAYKKLCAISILLPSELSEIVQKELEIKDEDLEEARMFRRIHGVKEDDAILELFKTYETVYDFKVSRCLRLISDGLKKMGLKR